jgi:hypothetical protein
MEGENYSGNSISINLESFRKEGLINGTSDEIGGLQFTGRSPFRVTKNGTVNGARPHRFMFRSPSERKVWATIKVATTQIHEKFTILFAN